MLTKEKWENMSVQKRARFIKNHFHSDLNKIADAIVSAILNHGNGGFRVSTVISMSSSNFDGMTLPTWYHEYTEEEYKNIVLGWLEKNYDNLFEDYSSLIENPSLHDGCGEYKYMEHDVMKLDIPGLFRLS